jgi:hypothetical protein
MLGDLVLITYVLTRSAVSHARERVLDLPGGRRLAGDAGEGVISTAIAVLIIALLGGVAFLVFQNVINSAGTKANDTVNQIGQ